jgi:hypothetical protein
MSQTYKLRLGDGTLLAVDEKGLHTWLADEDALVQAGGSNAWRSLKDVVATLARRSGPDDGVAIIPFKPQSPPPPASQMPSLRLAESNDDGPSDDDDIYDGDLYDEPGVLSVAWVWTKRLVLVSGLAVGGFYAAGTWETWLPEAGRFGERVFAQIEKHTLPPRPPLPSAAEDEARKLREAEASAAAQLPHLSPEAIQRVLASSVVGTLDPPEVFRRAYEAAERGASRLSSDDAQELRALQRQVFAGLGPADRDRVREYEHARGVRVTLPFEDREMLSMFARGARALPAPSRERLRVLYGKAIAATLATRVVAGATH